MKHFTVIMIVFFLFTSISIYSQEEKKESKFRIIIKNSKRNDSIDISLYYNKDLIEEYLNPFKKEWDFIWCELDSYSGEYDILVTSKWYPPILYKNVLIGKKRKKIIIIDYSKFEIGNKHLQIREVEGSIKTQQ